jgi:acyl carrier protein
LRASGWPAAAVAFGPIGQAGLAASTSERDRARLAAWGLAPMPLELAARQLLSEADASKTIAALDTEALTAGISRVAGVLPARFAPLAPAATPRAPSTRPAWRDEIATLDVTGRRARLMHNLRQLIGGLLGAEPSTIGERQRLFDLGVDSLMAVELKGHIEARIGATLRSTVAFDYPTVGALADHLSELVAPATAQTRAPEMGGLASPAPAAAPDPTSLADTAALATLTEEELAAMLRAELADAGTPREGGP